MAIIKNLEALANTHEKRVVLEIAEAGLLAIQPRQFLSNSIWVDGGKLTILDRHYNLDDFERIFLLGFGKGSAAISKVLEETLGYHLTAGFVIDLTGEDFQKIKFEIGTHPLPSQVNIDFTAQTLEEMGPMSEKDLVLTVVCGGGSALFELPHEINLESLTALNEKLLKSGATIFEFNTVRKHLSQVKAGGLAQKLYPATVAGLIASDVPGSDLSFVASGPTVRDSSTAGDARKVLEKYDLDSQIPLIETPKDDKFFAKVANILILSNKTALNAMKIKAGELGFEAQILGQDFQGDARSTGGELIKITQPGQVLLAGGETDVKVAGSGEGGRNQELVLGVLPDLKDITLASFDSDGWDNSPFAGAIADSETMLKAVKLGLNPGEYLGRNDSYGFFAKVGDGIETGRLPSNVSDLVVALRK